MMMSGKDFLNSHVVRVSHCCS